jgi:hypothetical protein
MNNCVFVTHATLDADKAKYCLKHLLSEQTESTSWDNFIIYNTHKEEVPNELLLDYIKKYDVNGYVKDILVFPYPSETPKNLVTDIKMWFRILDENELTDEGKTLILKSDYILSNNFNSVFNKIKPHNFAWTLPTYNGKEWVTPEQMGEKAKQDKFTLGDDETYFLHSDENHFNLPNTEQEGENLYEDELDPNVKFIGHCNSLDFNVHVVSNDVIPKCNTVSEYCEMNPNATWGGGCEFWHTLKFASTPYGKVKLIDEEVDWEYNIDAFAIHQFHEIISKVRLEDRGDPRKIIEGQRY